ncbi:MAG: UDP-N-acetylglucosamine pyrophosphorylase [Kiritimatiellae bacterium]|nr:UDP-N-acetylglucosamine pyrophosphorylase [Kiritimatiellia bacterium]
MDKAGRSDMPPIAQLLSKGVRMPAPDTVYVDGSVDPERIAPDVTIHPGCRLYGAELSIGPGCVLGAEAPVTVTDCQLGAGVQLAGGFFERATMLDGFCAGSGAHVRPGCLLEEAACIAHCVGLKQTILMPWVTTGSLINLCDCLMSGGTSRSCHSEVGSSYVHFNFTPHQDKATPSLIGNVPHGVLLNQPPIFLGGQGGLVGPCLLEHGTVVPAGQVWRGDVTVPGQLLAAVPSRRTAAVPYDPRRFPGIARIVRNNLAYIGNILALDLWYRAVRAPLMRGDPFQAACHAGARRRLDEILTERLLRLDEFANKVAQCLDDGLSASATAKHRQFVARWPALKAALAGSVAARQAVPVPPAVAGLAARLPAGDYPAAIGSLSPDDGRMLSDWLTRQVEEAVSLVAMGQ